MKTSFYSFIFHFYRQINVGSHEQKSGFVFIHL